MQFYGEDKLHDGRRIVYWLPKDAQDGLSCDIIIYNENNQIMGQERYPIMGFNPFFNRTDSEIREQGRNLAEKLKTKEKII